MKADKSAGHLRIGISGWTYPPWRGVFYPEKLPQKQELSYAAACFPSIEINGTFYSLQRPQSFGRWFDDTPDDFVFSVKGPRFVTHMKKLKDIGVPLANFFGSGVLRLGRKLGPVLWQLPPNFRFNPDRLEQFFALLPRTSEDAAILARQHDNRIADRAWLETDAKRPMGHALEIRHDSFRTPEFIALLRKYHVALVCADTPAWPRLMDVTSDFVYCRLHGAKVLYTDGYDRASLKQWAARISPWLRGQDAPDGDRITADPAPGRGKRDVFVYFDNDVKVRAPFDARELSRILAEDRD